MFPSSVATGVAHPDSFAACSGRLREPGGPPPSRFGALARRASIASCGSAPEVESLAFGVDQPTLSAASPSCPRRCPGADTILSSVAAVVGQPASLAASVNVVPGCMTPVVVVCRPGERASRAVAVGQPVGAEEDALPDVRGANARRCKIGGPDDIAFSCQVSTNSGEPVSASASRNLLAKQDWRAAVSDSIEPGGPEVALVGGASSLPGAAERLAGAGSGPHVGVVGDTGESEGEGPATEAGEEVAGAGSHKVGCCHVEDAALVDDAVGDLAGGGEVAEPLDRERLDLVVERTDHRGLLHVGQTSPCGCTVGSQAVGWLSRPRSTTSRCFLCSRWTKPLRASAATWSAAV